MFRLFKFFTNIFNLISKDDLNDDDIVILYAFLKSIATIPDRAFATALLEQLDRGNHQFALVFVSERCNNKLAVHQHCWTKGPPASASQLIKPL